MNEDYSKAIINGMVRYMRLLGAAPDMELHAGDVEWIAPKPECKGPSIVYKIELDIQSAGSRLDKLADDVRRERMPALWIIPPDSTPPDLSAMLKARGFRDISDPQRPEYGLALELAEAPKALPVPEGVGVMQVCTPEDFSLWIDTVNKALYGWPMLDADNYRHMFEAEDVALYLSLFYGEPAGTAAAIRSGSSATLEFVSTLAGFREKGVATAVCAHALSGLFNEGVRLVTLRAGFEAAGLFRQLGFREYFKTMVMKL